MASRIFILLAALLAINTAWAKLDVLATPSTISAKPGDKVHLNCILQNFTQPLVLKSFMVQWYARGKLVAEFDDKITINKEGFSMSLDTVRKGDASLTISSFTPDHAGNYRCYVYYKTDTSTKEIVLADESKTKAEEDHLTTCEAALEKKLDKVLKSLEGIDAKMKELKCKR